VATTAPPAPLAGARDLRVTCVPAGRSMARRGRERAAELPQPVRQTDGPCSIVAPGATARRKRCAAQLGTRTRPALVGQRVHRAPASITGVAGGACRALQAPRSPGRRPPTLPGAGRACTIRQRSYKWRPAPPRWPAQRGRGRTCGADRAERDVLARDPEAGDRVEQRRGRRDQRHVGDALRLRDRDVHRRRDILRRRAVQAEQHQRDRRQRQRRPPLQARARHGCRSRPRRRAALRLLARVRTRAPPPRRWPPARAARLGAAGLRCCARERLFADGCLRVAARGLQSWRRAPGHAAAAHARRARRSARCRHAGHAQRALRPLCLQSSVLTGKVRRASAGSHKLAHPCTPPASVPGNLLARGRRPHSAGWLTKASP